MLIAKLNTVICITEREKKSGKLYVSYGYGMVIPILVDIQHGEKKALLNSAFNCRTFFSSYLVVDLNGATYDLTRLN